MGELEVLICELLAVDALSTSALDSISILFTHADVAFSYVTTSEVTTLKHKIWDDTVELAASVAEALLTSAQSTEVLDSLWDNIVEELEVDATSSCCEKSVVFGTQQKSIH